MSKKTLPPPPIPPADSNPATDLRGDDESREVSVITLTRSDITRFAARAGYGHLLPLELDEVTDQTRLYVDFDSAIKMALVHCLGRSSERK